MGPIVPGKGGAQLMASLEEEVFQKTDESETFNVSAFSKMLTALKQIHILEITFHSFEGFF